MGLFSTKKKIYVASVAYNLAGDPLDRIQVLRSTVANSVLFGDPKKTLGEQIVTSQLQGPGINQQAFFRWAKLNYPKGTVTGGFDQQQEVDPALVLPHLSLPAGHVAFIESAFIDSADMGYWAERHILLNHPDRFDTAWTCDLVGNQLTIQYADLSTEVLTLTDFVKGAKYIFTYYNQFQAGTSGATTTGATTTGATSKPSTSGYSLKFSAAPVIPITLSRVVTTTVDDGVNPPSSSSTTTTSVVDFTDIEERWEKQVYVSTDTVNRRTTYHKLTRYIWADYTIQTQTTTETSTSGGVTTTVQTDQQILVPDWDWREDTTPIYSSDLYEDARLFIYRIGTTIPSLDALLVPQAFTPEFFPVIPVRLDNKSIRHTSFAADFPLYEKGYKRATLGNFNELIDLVDTNEKVGDIDYAYVWHGVELNTKDKAGLRYLYEFFRQLMLHQTTSMSDWTDFQNRMASYVAYKSLLTAWTAAQSNPADPLYRTPRPVRGSRPMVAMSTIRVHSTELPSVDFRLSWVTIDETLQSGLGKVGAKTGDLWFEILPDVPVPVMTTIRQGDENVTKINWGAASHSRVKLHWQYAADAFRTMEIIGFTHENFVYGGKSVLITAREALEDVDETGFIVPLHYPTLKKVPLATVTQLSVSNRLIVFNCYVVKKIRWYQSGIFRVILAVVIAVVSAIFAPAGIGLLGAHMTVGAALGLTGMAAVLVGAAVNAIAAMLLTAIIQKAAVLVLGEKWGQILGSILAAVSFQYVSGFMNGTGFTLDWNAMMRVDNLLKLTDAVTGMVTGYARYTLGEIEGKMASAEKSYEEQLREIQKKTEDILGYGNGVIDPLQFLELAGTFSQPTEPADTFLQRTTMTGSDIVELSHLMIYDYVDLNLELPDMFA